MHHTKISGGVKKQPYTLHACIYHIFTSKYPINVILKPRQIIHGTYTYAYIFILPLHNTCIRHNNYKRLLYKLPRRLIILGNSPRMLTIHNEFIQILILSTSIRTIFLIITYFYRIRIKLFYCK